MSFDRARAYGDGVFETVAIIGGNPQHWRRHMQRLHRGCRVLGLALPDPSQLLQRLIGEADPTQKQVARIAVYRRGDRGYRADFVCADVDIEICLSAWPPHYDDDMANGVALQWPTTRMPLDPLLGGLKHLNRLHEVIAASVGSAMTVTMDTHNRIVGATAANLFLRCGHRVYTPPTTHCGVAGVMRGVVIDALASGQSDQVHAVVVRPLVAEDIGRASEVWITSALRGVCSVNRIGDNAFMSREVADQLRSLIGADH